MKTFFNILQTNCDIKNKRYPDDLFVIRENINDDIYFGEKGHIVFLMNNIFYTEKNCIKKDKFVRNAFAKLNSLNTILQNDFYQNELKERIFNIFTKSQKHYYAFSRLAHIYKIKKHPYVVTNDLMMNTLDKNHILTFILIEEKSNFLFNINEIINIIETSIGNSPYFFSEPLWPLNPYNNQPLTLSTLYNIYFQMKNINRVTPLLFHCFFLENLSLNKFSEQHEMVIRENAIKKYVFNSPHTDLYTDVLSMLVKNKYTNRLSIHKNFPKDLLIDIFRPFLFYYYISNYYINDTLKVYNSSNLLYNKLRKFYEYNPSFGRQTIKLTRKYNRIIKREYVFNTKHITFYNISDNISIQNNNRVFFTNRQIIDTLININTSHIENYINVHDESNNNDNYNESQISIDNEYREPEVDYENDSIS